MSQALYFDQRLKLDYHLYYNILMPMPFFKGFKKLKKSITSRVDAHLSSAAQPSVSLPKASAPNILQAPSGRPASSRLEINIPVSARDSSAIPREQATSDRLSTGVLTPSLAADEVTSRSQQANLSHLAPTKSQPAIRHNPVAATSPVAAPPEQGGGTSSWQGLEAFLRALNQSAGVFGPLKVVVNDLVRCTEIYEVSEAFQRSLNGTLDLGLITRSVESSRGT